MKHAKSLLSKILLTIILPVALIFLATAGFSMYVISQDFNQFSEILNSMVLIDAIGFVMIIGVIILGVKKASDQISYFTDVTNRIVNDDSDLKITHPTEHPHDPLGQLGYNLIEIAERNKSQLDIANRIGAGDLSVVINPSSSNDRMGNSLMAIQNSVRSVLDHLIMMPESIKLEFNSDKSPAKDLTGDYKKAVEQVNLAMKIESSQKDFYMAVLDAMPYRVTVVDNDSKITFLNKTLGDLMKKTGTAEHREDMYGTACSDCNLQMCKTENCGVTAFKKSGRIEYPFEFRDRYYRMDTTAILNKKGETIGYLEVSHDTTPSESVAHYTKKEVLRLEENLERLSVGNLDFDMDIQTPSEYTNATYEQFMTIEKSLIRVKNSIGDLIADATQLTRAAIKGELEIRADETRFGGSWQKLIKGMNGILEKISKPINEVAAAMDEMSEGNLNATITGNYQGSFDALKTSVNTMGRRFKTVVTEISAVTEEIGNGNLSINDMRVYRGDFNAIIKTLNELLSDIHNAAEQVNAGANQISDSSQALAQGSTEQASSIQELTASITEIANQTKSNAVDANKARELATEVMENADKGNHQMSEMQRSMIDINKSSEDISKIIKVIDDIAFQTNILALNAAVEAARAGQHGKGFAVVAEEVRTLAARSAEAAKETTGLIEGSIGKVQKGTKIADQTAAALNEIVSGIGQVTGLIGNIATASNEQATGIAQINMGVEQVAQVVQQNSATAEQSAAASEELSGQSVLLKQMINQFQLR